MTITIALIALAHTIPIFVTRILTNSRSRLTIVAVVMAVVAIATGGAAYAVFDLGAVGLAYWICNSSIGKSDTTNPPKPVASPAPKKTSGSDSFIGGLVLVAVIGFLYFQFKDKFTPSPSSQRPQQTPAQPPKNAVSRSAVAKWVKVTETADGLVDYVDLTTIRKNGNLRTVWTIADSTKKKGPKGEMSMRALEEYDCVGSTVRVLSFSSHTGSMANGATLNSNNTASGWTQIPPDSVFQKKIRVVCAR